MAEEEKDTSNATDDNHIKSALIKAVEKIDAIYTSPTPYLGLTTGFNEFDELTGGLYPSNLIVIASRPSMGKTTLTMNIIEHTAIKLKKPAILFSLETMPEVSALKFICSLGRIDAHRFKTGKIEDDAWPRVSSSVDILSKAPIYMEHVIGQSIDTICAKSHEIALKAGTLGLIVVDYIQLLCHDNASSERRAAELSAITRRLKILAKELDVPVIAVSQLNRTIEQRMNKHPLLSDLRDSGSIEDDADLICFIYRDDYYNQDAEQNHIAELIIAKHRNGPQGTVKTAYLGECGRFEDLCFAKASTE